MVLRCLKISGIRNLATQTLLPAFGTNLLVGPNGSGKTSLLEAIHLLGRGRSFRTRSMEAVVNREMGSCSVYGELVDDQSNPDAFFRRLGVSRETGRGFCYRVDGSTAKAASVLADALPLVVINSHSLQVLEGPPRERRRFLDWGVFHTMPEIRCEWRRYHIAHQQRNALLRQKTPDASQLNLWDVQLADAGEVITRARAEYVLQMEAAVKSLLDRLSPELARGLELSLYPGWDRQQQLLAALKAHRDKDIMLRSTQVGPHRADLRISWNSRPATEFFSRGQGKVLVCALLLSQGEHFRRKRGRPCLSLIDDLPAELDDHHQQRIAEMLVQDGGQHFVTGTDINQMRSVWGGNLRGGLLKVFHVKQGQLRPENHAGSG